MKITSLTVYPIKALRGISLDSAVLTPQGIAYDRTYILLKPLPDGSHKKMQLASFPECALFSQEIVAAPASAAGKDTNGSSIVVRYHRPAEPLAPAHPLQDECLTVPLDPEDLEGLEEIAVDLHGSSTTHGRKMPQEHSAWFSACFGFPVLLVHIGAGRRPVLGSFAPGAAERQQQEQKQAASSWLPAAVSSLLPASWSSPSAPDDAAHWLTFTDCSPLLVASEASLADVSARLPADQPAQMHKFRPNIVIDAAGEDPWAEDFWAELSLPAHARSFLLTANCVRCTSLNVDYDTGRTAAGERGAVLKKLMKDRRVDPGSRYSPVFGRYAFVDDREGAGDFSIRVGDEVSVARRNEERTVYDWPGLGTPVKKPAAVAA